MKLQFDELFFDFVWFDKSRGYSKDAFQQTFHFRLRSRSFRRISFRASSGFLNCNSLGVTLPINHLSLANLFLRISLSISCGVVFVVTRSTVPISRYPSSSASICIRMLIKSRCSWIVVRFVRCVIFAR